MNVIPAVCNSCGYTFPSPFSLAGSRNSAVIGCGTNCPRCGGNARVVDSFTDSQGNLHLQGFINHLRAFSDTAKLKQFKTQVEEAEDVVTAQELTEALVELDPSFSKFNGLISSIPEGAIKYFINLIMGIITLVIAYQTWQSADENHDESLNLQRDQLELAREEFEYKKLKDQEAKKEKSIEFQNQIDQLKAEFEAKLQQVQPQPTQKTQRAIKARKSTLKGSSRNKPCPCGSGKKAKKCHPNGFAT